MKASYGNSFHCTFVYGMNSNIERRKSWDQLSVIADFMKGAWVVLGDFNSIADFEERSGSVVRTSDIEPLQNCLAHCSIRDINYSGRFFTWNNKQGKARILSKIDCVVANADWFTQFPDATTIFLPEGYFDHSPALLNFFPCSTPSKPFKFLKFLSNHPNFQTVC